MSNICIFLFEKANLKGHLSWKSNHKNAVPLCKRDSPHRAFPLPARRPRLFLVLPYKYSSCSFAIRPFPVRSILHWEGRRGGGGSDGGGRRKRRRRRKERRGGRRVRLKRRWRWKKKNKTGDEEEKKREKNGEEFVWIRLSKGWHADCRFWFQLNRAPVIKLLVVRNIPTRENVLDVSHQIDWNWEMLELVVWYKRVKRETMPIEWINRTKRRKRSRIREGGA